MAEPCPKPLFMYFLFSFLDTKEDECIFLDCRVSAHISSPSTFSSTGQSKKTTGHPIFV